jgi:hypothetical protein
VFGSVVAVVFQNVFHSEMYQNNIFFIFDISALERSKNTKKNINLKQKKIKKI